MIALFHKKRHEEPSLGAAYNASGKVCSIDHTVMRAQLEEALYRNNAPASFKELYQQALGFMSKKHGKLYFEASYKVLAKEFVLGGLVEVLETQKGNEYLMTAKGRALHENRGVQKYRGLQRHEWEITASTVSFLESITN